MLNIRPKYKSLWQVPEGRASAPAAVGHATDAGQAQEVQVGDRGRQDMKTVSTDEKFSNRQSYLQMIMTN